MKKGLLLVFATAIISGFSIFINKFGVAGINPYVFAGLKNIVVAILICCLLIAMKDWRLLKALDKKSWLLLLAIGLLGGSIPFLLFFKGLTLTTAVWGSFLHKTMFVYVIILAGLFLKEKISSKLLIGSLLLILGNVFLLKLSPHSLGLGDLLIFLATLLWAAENVISKYVLKDLPARIVIWGRMFFGSIFILLFLGITGQITLIGNLNTNQFGWVLLTGVLLGAYVLTWYTGLKFVPVSVATAILLLGAPITALLDFVYNGVIDLGQILGMVLAVGGALVLVWGFGHVKETKLYLELK